MNKLHELNEKIENAVVSGYKKIETGVVDGYKKIENTVVDGYKKVEDKCIDALFSRVGETTEETRARLTEKNGGAKK